MGYILMGHGALVLGPALKPTDLGVIAIPESTTVQFYSDAGQKLAYGSRELDMWEQLKAHEEPVGVGGVTYNFTLGNAAGNWPEDLKNKPRFGGKTLILPGVGDFPDPIRLCEGTAATCPTDPRQVVSGAKPRHGCHGILGRLAGHDLHWLACTAFVGADPSVAAAALGDRAPGIILGTDPEFLMSAFERAAVVRANSMTVECAEDGALVDYAIGGSLLLLGDHCADFMNHPPEHRGYVMGQPDLVQGTLTVFHEGGRFPTGRFAVRDTPPAVQDAIRTSLEGISHYETQFMALVDGDIWSM
ncbi:hypothetical protein AB0N09_42350 [Streptomyces erythrochromogenes]|uniref:hypothetical protein n=1 Tax=Streptomyces erythrochromogenes TaxID=285574 RepID=UPI00342266FE